ncbi:acetyl/propionyl-CoA carboxylase, alpha subunit [Anaerolinea thermolimosa]|uniref:acetyl-CoA carboxylase biotin carboxyl carrier protein subunit n=1 Tax=Anaerolinea thermolimosa TaxID=229919 RepID=UPI0007866405|nr:acetyl-CoA carboxylase biotin carboxyl carrier protein subunit [Anaerolinea thermolimosa]GAP06697.1 acetyl/propionyl-CoA carboxylase, alpha subunit [Anaerolinea thermolimosa]
MAIYHVTVGRKEYRVEIQPGQYKVNGRLMDMQLQQLNSNGLYLVERDKQKVEMLLKPMDAGRVSVVVNQRHLMVRVERNSVKIRNGRATHSQDEILAPMPGVVVQLLAVNGQAVQAGDVVLIIESMKMQMEIRAHLPGKIERLSKKPGDKIDKGEVLACIRTSP